MYLRGEPYLRVYDESAAQIAKLQENDKETKDRMRDIQIGNLEMKAKLQDFDKMQAQLNEMREEMRNYKTKVIDHVFREARKLTGERPGEDLDTAINQIELIEETLKESKG